MTKKLVTLVTVAGLVVSACGDGEQEATASADRQAATTTTSTVEEEASDAVAFDEVEEEQQAIATDPATFEPVSYAEGTLGALVFDAAQESVTSGSFEGSLNVTAPPGTADGDMALAMSGRYDHLTRSAELSLDLAGLVGQELGGAVPPEMADVMEQPAEVRIIGDEAWIRWGLLGMMTGSPESWLALSSGDLVGATGSMGLGVNASDPMTVLGMFGPAAAVSVEELGGETVRDVETRHVLAMIDPAGIEGMATADADLGVSEIPVELWIGVDDGLLRRMTMHLELTDPVTGTGTVDLMFEMFDLGAEVAVTPPPADEVIDGSGLFPSF